MLLLSIIFAHVHCRENGNTSLALLGGEEYGCMFLPVLKYTAQI